MTPIATVLAICVAAQPTSDEAPPVDPLSRALNQLGSEELGEICAVESSRNAEPCKFFNGPEVCGDRTRKMLAACRESARQTGGTKGVIVDKTPKPIPNPMRLPEVVDAAVAACQIDELGCFTLADFASSYGNGFRGLSAWCLVRKLEKDSGRLPPVAASAANLVCSALEATTDLGALDHRIEATNADLKSAKQKLQQATSDEMREAAQREIGTLQRSLAGLQAEVNEKRNENGRALGAVPTAYLSLIRTEAGRVTFDCSGFGLTVPMVRIRRPRKSDIQVSGPLAAGVGAGYYWSPECGCHEEWSWGIDAFAYSEGLDLTNDLAQFGVALGVGVVAYDVFHFGVAVGYDLYRQERNSAGTVTRNGLFSGKQLDRPSVSYLITLTLFTKSSEKGEKTGT